MISTYNKFILPEFVCREIKNRYESKLIFQENSIRKQKNYHETDPDSWLYNFIDDFIKKNIGNEYSLLERVTILKYEQGDFFSKHTDGIWNSTLSKDLPIHFYGGVELSEKKEFEGGEFFIKDKKVDYLKGRLFTHGFEDSHGVEEVKKGIRWSLHFLITNYKPKALI
tara:strand:+ start:222 stop:725 length:504 start_codon:yes stop_codon:yes gene_type:complete